MKDIIIEILKNNPGIATVALSSVLLPIAILIVNNRQNRKLKKAENDFELEKAKFLKQVESSFQDQNNKRNHEKVVHASLIKILFEVQKLHIALSGNCVDYNCIEDAVKNFKDSFTKYQDIISDNQIYLSSKVTNHLYLFYKLLGQLLVELKEIRDSKQYDLAIVSVYNYSQLLADAVIEIQSDFIKNRKDIHDEFDKADLRNFRQCCGQEPPQYLVDKYNEAKRKLENLAEPIEGVFEN